MTKKVGTLYILGSDALYPRFGRFIYPFRTLYILVSDTLYTKLSNLTLRMSILTLNKYFDDRNYIPISDGLYPHFGHFISLVRTLYILISDALYPRFGHFIYQIVVKVFRKALWQ
jgi:hypothetical protein